MASRRPEFLGISLEAQQRRKKMKRIVIIRLIGVGIIIAGAWFIIQAAMNN